MECEFPHSCSGTVVKGGLRVGEVLELPDLKLQRKVKGMQMFKAPVAACARGDRVGICVTQVDAKLIERGLACTPGARAAGDHNNGQHVGYGSAEMGHCDQVRREDNSERVRVPCAQARCLRLAPLWLRWSASASSPGRSGRGPSGTSPSATPQVGRWLPPGGVPT